MSVQQSTAETHSRTSFCLHRAAGQGDYSSLDLRYGEEITVSLCSPLDHLSLVFEKGGPSSNKGASDLSQMVGERPIGQ